MLEWTIARAGAIRWQYRQLGPGVYAEWEAWTDIPDSVGSTTSHKLTDLQRGRRYDFQVRPWTAHGPGVAYDTLSVSLRAH